MRNFPLDSTLLDAAVYRNLSFSSRYPQFRPTSSLNRARASLRYTPRRSISRSSHATLALNACYASNGNLENIDDDLSFRLQQSNRVTMKLDVSYTDHSHIIGKGGLTIKRVMEETGCHIHFPDSNRSNHQEKSNQVSIAGEMEGVERARARVRVSREIHLDRVWQISIYTFSSGLMYLRYTYRSVYLCRILRLWSSRSSYQSWVRRKQCPIPLRRT